jgi:ion channel-forming bestrophin family protein
VNVALPPTDGEPTYAKGKTPQPNITNAQLRRRKIEALQLCLSFVFATKHYLRAEDGIDHPDYQGVIPQSLMQSREIVSASQSRSQSRYDLTKQNDGSSPLVANPPANSPSDNISVYEQSNYGTNKTDATKRVRVKRSKPQLANQATPLVNNHMTPNTDLYINALEESMPLPLMCVLLIAVS